MTEQHDPYAKIAKHQRSLPVNVEALAEELGAKVWESDFWIDGISGMIRKDAEYGGTQGYAIVVNKRHPEERKRFTVAHEIAHLILHRDQIGDGISDDVLYHSRLQGLHEEQANNLAVDILMPWDRVFERIESGDTDIEKLAKTFRVPKSAMSIRLMVPFETAAPSGEGHGS